MHEKPKQWLPCILHKRKQSSGAKELRLPNETWSNGTRSLMMRDSGRCQCSKLCAFVCWKWNRTQIIVHSTSQHSATCQSGQKLVRKEAGFRTQYYTPLCAWNKWSWMNRVGTCLHFFTTVLSHWDFFHGKFRLLFLRESQLWQSCATQPTVHAVCWSVSIIHRTLTWIGNNNNCINNS